MIGWIRQRRSCRKFEPDPVAEDLRALLIEACLRAPTSKNRRPWQFIFVEGAEERFRLSHCKPHGAAFLAEAPLNIVIAAEPRLSDVWVEDCAIAAALVQVTAQSLGLGSCWCQVRLREADNGQPAADVVKEVLALPKGWEVASIIGVGYPAEAKPAIDAGSLPRERCQVRP